MTKKTVLTLSVLALVTGLASGCATTDEINALKAQVVKAQQTADEAMSMAETANTNAASASEQAAAAMSAADAAQNAADNCSERCDRMMEKAMAK
ncbi:MAG TPA: gamma-glutamyltranspeptidase [Sedimenticola sp.]|nr:gamma-glutamyltranspeptidase [Sedimenticola sp.]